MPPCGGRPSCRYVLKILEILSVFLRIFASLGTKYAKNLSISDSGNTPKEIFINAGGIKMPDTNLYEDIRGHLKSKNIDALKQLLNSVTEVDVLEAIQELSAESQGIVYRLLSKDKALYVFEQLDTASQQQLLHSFADEAAIELIESMPPDDRVQLLDELPATVAKKMLAALSPKEREMTNLLMGYEEKTAGRIMTPEYVRISRHMSATEALEKVKINAEEKETIYTLYITDDSRKLEGVISLRDLLIAKSDDKIENIMQEITAKVSTDTDQEEVARLLQRLDWLAIPVVDKENRLVGIITVDDAMDILEEESTEDMFNKAGITDLTKNQATRSDVVINGSIWAIWKVRLPFLILTLFGGLLAGSVIGAFEEVLQSVVFVAVFIPVIMDMGGNVGVQSSTVFLRGTILGHIKEETIKSHIFKEVSVGFTMGLVVGITAGIAAYVWQGIPGLGLAVGLSLILVMTFASFLGFIDPYLLMKMNVDKAAGTDPIITTIKDISGLFIYFVLVNFFLGHLL
jgi:magnesium transporter